MTKATTMDLREMLLKRATELEDMAAAADSNVARAQLADIAHTYRELAEVELQVSLHGPKKSG